MSDDAYIPPSERRITSNESITVPCGCGRCIACEFGNGTKTIHRRITFDDHGLLASHAVVDSVAADLAAALREACDGEEICDCWRCRERKPYGPCGWGVRVREQVDAALARYDALHKEAGQ